MPNFFCNFYLELICNLVDSLLGTLVNSVYVFIHSCVRFNYYGINLLFFPSTVCDFAMLPPSTTSPTYVSILLITMEVNNHPTLCLVCYLCEFPWNDKKCNTTSHDCLVGNALYGLTTYLLYPMTLEPLLCLGLISLNFSIFICLDKF